VRRVRGRMGDSSIRIAKKPGEERLFLLIILYKVHSKLKHHSTKETEVEAGHIMASGL